MSLTSNEGGEGSQVRRWQLASSRSSALLQNTDEPRRGQRRHYRAVPGPTLGGVRGVYDQHKYQEEMQRAFEALATQIERIVNPPAGNVVQLRRR